MSHPKNMKLRPSPADWETYILSSAKDRLKYTVYKPEPKSSFGPVQKFLKKTTQTHIRTDLRFIHCATVSPRSHSHSQLSTSAPTRIDMKQLPCSHQRFGPIYFTKSATKPLTNSSLSLPSIVNREQRRQEGHYGCHWPAPKLDLMPVTIGHVCRYWNQLITTNPKFWNRIFMYMHPKTFAPMYHLDQWMERSAPLPVSLYFDAIAYYIPNIFDPEFDIDKSLMNGISAIHHYAHRFEHLSLKVCGYGLEIWKKMIDRGQRADDPGPLCLDFALLASVDITSKHGWLHGDDWMRMHHKVAAAICGNRDSKVSRLRSGSYSYIENIEYSPLDELHIPLDTYMNNLTSLELTYYIRIDIPVSTFLSQISHIHKLTELWLVGTTFNDISELALAPNDFGFVYTRVVLPSIEKLHLLVSTQPDSSHCQYVSDCVAFLAGVSLPNLTALDMDEHSIASFLNGEGPTRWTFLFDMLSESGCFLRSLKLILKDSLRPEHPHWDSFFQSETCSSLQELTIQPRTWNTQDVLYLSLDIDGLHRSYHHTNKDLTTGSSVAPLHNTPLVTPTLKRLTILGCITEDEPLVRLATSWMEGENSCLEYLYIEVEDLHSEKHPKAIHLFDDLYKRGKKAYLRKPPVLTALQYT